MEPQTTHNRFKEKILMNKPVVTNRNVLKRNSMRFAAALLAALASLVAASNAALIRAAEANVARVTDKTIVIPGHGPVGNKSRLIEFRDMPVSVREKVSALKKQGKSLDEVLAAKPTADYDAKWGGFVIDGKNFTGLVYQGV